MNKNICLFILSGVFLSAGVFAFADQPSSSLDDKPSVDSAASSGVQVPAVPSDSDSTAEAHANYLYDLKKLIEKSKENIKEVNEKIKEQAVLKRNQKREERAREYYEKGVELTNEGKLDEAREYFDKAIRITEHPEMTGYIKESERRLHKQESALQAQESERNHQIKEDENTRKEDVEAAYKAAVDLYKQKKYHPAKDSFEHVNEIAPDYRATDSYLKIIDQDIVLADALAAKQQVVEIQHQQKEAEAARLKEKQTWLQQIEDKEKERKDSVNKQAAEVYDRAVELYKLKKYAEAKKKFEEVSWVIPDYKATMKYLARIDHDAQLEKERVAQEQQKALADQRWEEEVENKKQEAQKQQELEAKERQQKKDLEEQAQFLYKAAVSLYDKKNMDEALEKFNDIEKLYPDYKSTRIYIARIQQTALDQQKQNNTSKAQKIYDQAVESYRNHHWEESKAQFESVEEIIPDFKHTRAYLQKIEKLTAPKAVQAPVKAVSAAVVVPPPAQIVVVAPKSQQEDQRQKELALERQRAQELKDKTDQAKKIYSLAIRSYRDHHWEESRAQFESVEQILPDFKRTHHYLQKISDAMVSEAKKTTTPPPGGGVVVASPKAVAISTPSAVPAHVNAAVSLEDQQKKAQDIAALAEKSARLYRQVADIANDSSTAQTKDKLAEVNSILNNLKENQERLLRQMQEEQSRHQEQESKARQEEHRAEVEKMYQDALGYYRSHDYAKAKTKFLELDNLAPDYKSTRHLLSRVDEELKKANFVAVTSYEQNQAGYLNQLQNAANAAQMQREQQEQEKQQNFEKQQQETLKELAQKASGINDDIIRLSKQQDYEGMKVKFTALENTITALTTLKEQMIKQKESKLVERKLAREAVRQNNEMLKGQKVEDRQMRSYYRVQPLKEYRPEFQPDDADQYKRREIMQEQNMLYSEGVNLYAEKKYTQAKLLFGELDDQHDRRAEVWLKKVDRAITQQLLKSQEAEARERTAFIEEQLRAQRELIVIQERERERQKKLTEELERQKRLYEDDRLLQLRKEEVMKAQERERQRQEEKRLQKEKELEKQQEMLRFHKIEIVAKPPVVVTAPVVIPAAVTKAPAAVVPPPVVATTPTLTPKQLQAQIDFSDKRKAFLDAQYSKEQKEKARQAKIQAAADARQKRLEEKQKEIEHQKELRAQREQERQAKIQAAAELKAKLAKEKAEKLAQEQKRREEVLQQQEEARAEKMKQEEILREETQRREDLQRQEHQQQAQLEAQREAVRKQLEDGVEAIYQEALALYQQGQYAQAADRFKDVQDILPGYKRAGQYMDEARLKSLAAPASSSVSNQDNVSKALDLFDSK